jgi:hypothetical protein
VVFLEPLDTEVFGSGSTAVEVLRFAVRLLFLDDTGRAVGRPRSAKAIGEVESGTGRGYAPAPPKRRWGSAG